MGWRVERKDAVEAGGGVAACSSEGSSEEERDIVEELQQLRKIVIVVGDKLDERKRLAAFVDVESTERLHWKKLVDSSSTENRRRELGDAEEERYEGMEEGSCTRELERGRRNSGSSELAERGLELDNAIDC